MSEDDASIFASKTRSFALVAGWGAFTILILLPLFRAMDIYISNIFFWIYLAVLIIFVLIMILWGYLIMRSRFGFWFDEEVFNPLWNAIFPALSGFIISGFLNWWFFMVCKLFIVETVFSIWIPVALLIYFFFLLRYRKWKIKGERHKYARGKSEDIEEVVRKTLDSLNLKYSRVVEGSKWTMLVPSYRIEGSEISVKVRQARRREAVIVIKALSTSEIPRAREIEKTIDSLINISDF